MRRFLLLGAALAAFTSSLACGGNVVVDGPGGGGQGGDGGSPPGTTTGPGTTSGPGTTTTSGTFTGTTTPTAPFDIQAYCKSACDVLSSFDCDISTACAEDCALAFDQTPVTCQDEFVAYVDCFLGALPEPGCQLAPQCEELYKTYSNCNSPPGDCTDFGCSGDGETCYCSAECQGQYREVECKAAGNGFLCNCYVDGNIAGTCSDFDASCDIEAGCCTEFF